MPVAISWPLLSGYLHVADDDAPAPALDAAAGGQLTVLRWRDEVQLELDGHRVLPLVQRRTAGSKERIVGQRHQKPTLDDAGALPVAVGHGHEGCTNPVGGLTRPDSQHFGEGGHPASLPILVDSSVRTLLCVSSGPAIVGASAIILAAVGAMSSAAGYTC